MLTLRPNDVFNELPFAGQSGVSSPPPDASKFEPTNFLGFPAKLIAEQLTKIETVSSLYVLPYIYI